MSATAYYRPESATALFRGEGSSVRLTESPDEMAELRAKWLEVIPGNGSFYLRHRWEGFKSLTAMGKEEVCFPYLATSHQFGGYAVNDWRVHRLLRAVFWKLRNTFFFRGLWWLIVIFALLCLSLAGRLGGDLEAVFALSLSGFLYGAAYFFFATACDFRFLWWTALAALVGLCLSMLHAVELWHSRAAPPAQG